MERTVAESFSAELHEAVNCAMGRDHAARPVRTLPAQQPETIV